MYLFENYQLSLPKPVIGCLQFSLQGIMQKKGFSPYKMKLSVIEFGKIKADFVLSFKFFF